MTSGYRSMLTALATLMLAALMLAACATRAPPVASVAPGVPLPAPVPPPRETEMAAIVASLDRGAVAAASPRIDALLLRFPGDADVKLLRTSIDADPVALLGRASFAYKVRPGDTLRALARRFLGNRLRFYALARYNDIAVPLSLAAGATIRIPGVAPVRAPPPKSVGATPRTDPAGAQRLRLSAIALLRAGRTADAIAALRKAATLDPGDPLIRRDLQRLGPAVPK